MTEPLRQRQPPIEDAAHREFVRHRRCCVCGHPPLSACAHIRMASPDHGKRETGKGEKPSDRYTVPLCDPMFAPGKRRWCHQGAPQSQHSGSESAFWDRVGLDPFAIAEALWVDSGAAARHLGDAKPRAAKARKARPRPDKIKRNWPSKPFQKGRGFNR